MPADYRERITEQLRDLYNRINAYTTKWRTNNIPEIKFKLKTKVIKCEPILMKYRYAKRIG